MRKNAFEIGEIINNFKIIKKEKSIKLESGATKAQWLCECLLCGKSVIKSTQTIQSCNSCGCQWRDRGYKVKNSGRKSPINTDVGVNTLISIYKSNSRKRNIEFNLSYQEFKNLINGECFYCGEKDSNILKKKGYVDFKYNGIDRVNNDIGYTIDNCITCCRECNRMKRNSKLDDFYARCYRIIKRKIEKDEKYFDVGVNRVKESIKENFILEVR